MSFFSSLLALILILTGCQTYNPFPKGSYVLPVRPGGRMCVLQCQKAVNRCVEGCDLQRRACFVTMQTQALKDYESYTREQFRTRQPTDLRLRDFEQPEKCEVDECKSDCTPPYNICYEKCGGALSVTRSPLHLLCDEDCS